MTFFVDKQHLPKEFSLLPDSELALIEPVAYERREYLIREGDFGRMDLFYIVSGVCINDLLVQLGGNFFLARKIQPGEFIGLQEIISLTPRRRETSVIAKTPVTALRIPGKDLLRWQVDQPGFYNYVVSSVLDTHFDHRALNVNCASKDTTKAGCYYLLYLYQAYLKGCHPPGYEGPVKIWDTRQEIAQALSRDVRSVDRMLKDLREEGVITVDTGKIFIDNKQAASLAARWRALEY